MLIDSNPIYRNYLRSPNRKKIYDYYNQYKIEDIVNFIFVISLITYMS